MNRRRLGMAAVLGGLVACADKPLLEDVMSKPAATPLWFIFLERGRPTPEDKAAVAAMQRGHIDNFKRLFAEKKLFSAGPLRDPSGFKRGIVIAQAPTREALQQYFEPDEYVREGFMSVNAVPAQALRALHVEGIDPEGIEESRILLLGRAAQEPTPELALRRRAHLQLLLDQGRIGAWYRLASGPVAEVLFARTNDKAALQAALAAYPGVADKTVSLEIWPQWLGKGVLR
ncbi:uncharacterized protein YciI [Paucibacter oligotrophus]|uniref:Uncharacterized protein YciI n=1 Tax=Roseateles oligotrophus TaxID=1769250 RepID=A0A840L3L0_9BURK|nr:hypothetical protein [Roseateles oligotrophus]MBB4842800.1 uncharacterized protein YciI [Roseateles oligotrophus]